MTLTRAALCRALTAFLVGWAGGCVSEKIPSDCIGARCTPQQPDDDDCFCPLNYSPVCGADGKTYGNSCAAGCADVPVARSGECKGDPGPAPNPGVPGTTPPTAGGTTPVPTPGAGGCICPAIFKPVCGADGKTYGNSCEASCAKVPVASEGECKDAGPGTGTSCMSNADCVKGTICYPLTHRCQAECTINCLVYDPVCGADGKTYGCGKEDALCHGVEPISAGECAPTTGCGCTKEFQPVCGVDRVTYANRCMAKCAGVLVLRDGSCDGSTCNTDQDCPHGYCEHFATCAAIGCPAPPPSKCTVCGDGSALLCKQALLPCPDGQVREIVNSCYGACVERTTCRAPAGGGCEYNGKRYQLNESFPTSDGCNTCTCIASGVECTLRACLCDYSAPGRSWVAKSPEQCKAVKFACAAGQHQFFDSCGCGCEPDSATACRVGGCSGQLCVGPGEPDITTCEWREAYACYKTAKCALQANGRCGWSETDALLQCLKAAQ